MNRYLHIGWLFSIALVAYAQTDSAQPPGTAEAQLLTDTSVQIFLTPPSVNAPGCINTRVDGAPGGTQVFTGGVTPVIPDLPRGDYVFSVLWCAGTLPKGDPIIANGTTDTIFVPGPPLPDPPAQVFCANCNEIAGAFYRDFNGTYEIDWTPEPEADTYHVQEATFDESTQSYGPWSDLASPQISGKPNGRWTYRVRSCNGNGCSDNWQSIDRDVVVLRAPAVPTSVSVTTDFSEITVDWSAPSGPVDYYEVREFIDGVQSNGSQPFTVFAPTTILPRPLPEFAEYSYRVRACNANCGPLSPLEEVTVTIANCAAQPMTPINNDCGTFSSPRFDGPATNGITGVALFALELADRDFRKGAAFLCEEYEGLYRTGDVERDSSGVPTEAAFATLNNSQNPSVPTYNEALLDNAEALYACALTADPVSGAAAEGILRVSRAKVEKANLAVDLRRKELFVDRFAVPAPDIFEQVVLVQREIDSLEVISQEIRRAIATILGIYTDNTAGGAGALLRGEFAVAGSTGTQDTIRLLLSTLSRFSEVEVKLGRSRIDRLLYDDGPGGRAMAIDQLDQAAAYVTTVSQVLQPFVNESTFDLPDPDEPGSTEDELVNAASLAKANQGARLMAEITAQLREGYTPFGFVPDFVPFLPTEQADNSNLQTFYRVRDDAISAIADLGAREETICGECDGSVSNSLLDQIRQFANNDDSYALNVSQLSDTYQQRLRTLVGTAERPNSDELEADVFTYQYPDIDLNPDDDVDLTKREERREELLAEGYVFYEKGQIAEQYLTILDAENRVNAAYDQMQDLVQSMEFIEREARELSQLSTSVAEDIFERILADGSRVSLLTKQRGYAIQSAADREAKKRRRRGIFAAMTNHLIGTLAGMPQPGAVINALAASSTSGSAAAEAGVIDAQINDIQTLQRADIVILEAARFAEQTLIDAKYRMANLALSQNDLALDYVVAQRNVDREYQALARMLSEASSLLADSERNLALLQEVGNSEPIGWAGTDIRDTLNSTIVLADKTLDRAKVKAFVAIRALDYYAGRPPLADGRPAQELLDLYIRLYLARRSEELMNIVGIMNSLADTQFNFTEAGYSCPSRGLLSLKYDVFSSGYVALANDGEPIDPGFDADFRYFSVIDDQQYFGTDARQALFRDRLRQTFTSDGNTQTANRKLEIRFGTNLFPPQPSEFGIAPTNPFYLNSSRAAKIIGFPNSGCQGIGVPADAQGIQISLYSASFGVLSPSVDISQEGNSYLKHTRWEAGEPDFNTDGRLANPLQNITVYTAYEQLLPSWLFTDLSLFGVPPAKETIGSAVTDTISPLIGLQPGGGAAPVQTLAFADRAVANDSWRLVVKELDANNPAFLDKLEQMLCDPNDPIYDPANHPGVDPGDIFDCQGVAIGSSEAGFLTDIQLRIGWASRTSQVREGE